MKRPIAFYLPQFHPIPENDKWWGKGFTEWRNVARGLPQFEGHIQPNIPGELGYYDLRIEDIQRQQVDMAKRFGVFGFCFYYYWFSGKRLLEFPLNSYVGDRTIDFPFCICWANETWSRRWDGSETDVLIEQNYSAEHSEAVFKDFLQYLKDPRYIEIDGKKLILIYRACETLDLGNYTTTWRRLAHENDIKIMICLCLTFGGVDPTPSGLDAAVQFPPHGVRADEITEKKATVPEFKGKIYSYPSLVAEQLADPIPTFPLFRGVMPSWDNTARRRESAHIYTDHSPALFYIWLNDAFDKTFADEIGNRYIFINAWNEWAEGAFLEPDAYHGMARLESLRSAVNGVSRPDFALDVLKGLSAVSSNSTTETIEKATLVLEESLAAAHSVLGELRQLVMKERSPYELFAPVLPTKAPWLSSARAIFLPGARGSFDRLGSLLFENGLRVAAGRTLYTSGWILPPTPESARTRTHVMIILTAEEGQSFFFESPLSSVRKDVAEHIPDWPSETASNSGFHLNLCVDDLPTSTYTAVIGVACGGYVYLLEQRHRLVIVQPGQKR